MVKPHDGHIGQSDQWYYIDELVQERCNSSALAMELRLSCTNPLIYTVKLVEGVNGIIYTVKSQESVQI